MALLPGTRIGPYEITAQIGVGGMGEVYRARDTKLDRDVAIKVLPESVAGDSDRIARFQREAKTLAALNHPNIAAIYGLEEVDLSTGSGQVAIKSLVMEMVEGPTLADRIAQGAIPLDEALAIAKQIAAALEAAHEGGIIHRDLKPANIKVRSDDTVKVLDFGLAKAMEPANAMSASASMSPTITTPAMTQAGMILGTAAYMSPEQAKGKPADRRSDVWAFGAVLYEMLTSKRAFRGDDVQDTFVAIMRDEPDWSRLPATLSPTLGIYLRRCLHKDQKQRIHDIADVRLALEGAFESAAAQAASPIVPNRRRHVAALVAGALVVAVVTGAAVWFATRPVASQAPESRLDMTTPPTTAATMVGIAISPDGRRVAFVSTTDGQSHVWVRSLDAVAPQPLAGTDGASFPFWSPDSESVGFFAEGKLKRIDIAGGSVQVLADASSNARGGAWNRDGVILFAPTAVGPIYQVSATGGQATVLTQLEKPAQTDHRAPQFLPDGRHFLYYARGTAEGRGVYVGGLDGSHSPRLIDADAAAVYAAAGHLLFVRGGTLFAIGFDPDRLALVGNPFPVAQQVIVQGGVSMAALSASEAGPIIYRAGVPAKGQLAWIDRSGNSVELVGEADDLNGPALSPDGREIVIGRNIGSNWDLWLTDVARGVRRRLTSDPALEANGVWSPDGSRIAFGSAREGGRLVTKSVTGTEREDVLLELPAAPLDWSPDGRFLLLEGATPTTGSDLWALSMGGDGTRVPLAQSPFNERDGQFSPDGQWVAYASDESGRSEIYVQPFPGPGDKTQVSTAGGAQVRWRGDGKELFYVALDAQLMAVPMQLPSSGSTIAVGRPGPLFATHIGGAVLPIRTQYAVARDGQRFLMSTRSGETPPITVILNWTPKP